MPSLDESMIPTAATASPQRRASDHIWHAAALGVPTGIRQLQLAASAMRTSSAHPKVAALQKTIAEGRYRLDAGAIAAGMIQIERQLGG